MLEIQNLIVAYSNHPVLKGISMRVERGEVVAVIGPNGAGKTTLIRAISGVIPFKSGTIRVADQNILKFSDSQRACYLAVVPQARELPGAFTVEQTVMLGRTPHLGWLGRPGETDQACVRFALERTHTTALADRPVGTLSGGEQQRVMLARALAQNTPVLLLDEPTTHLDLQHTSGFLNLVRELATEKDLAVLMVMHDLNLSGLYADRVILFVDGRVHASGVPSQVLTESNLTSVYQVPVQVTIHPEYGSPLILPDGFPINGDHHLENKHETRNHNLEYWPN